MDELTELRRELGKTVEDTGRMLRRKKPFTEQELTDLRDTLNSSGEVIQTIRDALYH